MRWPSGLPWQRRRSGVSPSRIPTSWSLDPHASACPIRAITAGGMEEVLSAHPDVAECAVMGVADDLKGEIPLGLLVLKSGVERDDAEIVKEAIQMIRDRIGPVAAFKVATVVERLPKTRSGKVLRGTMKKIADGEDYKMPATIDDPAILTEIAARLQEIGYPQGQ